MDYIEVKAIITPYSSDVSDILISNLGELGFESFTETENGILAYIQANLFNINLLTNANTYIPDTVQIKYEHQLIKAQNWNAVWESNFEPIVIDNQCIVRAPFHNIKEKYTYEIIIEPKMSFGTGHHQTTHLMMSQMLTIDFKGKKVLDMGCGTALLAILASKLEASNILAIDIDNWAYENSIENCSRNNCSNIEVKEGDASLLKEDKFDIILANINRNILLNDISAYSKVLNNEGKLMMSGFYTEDLNLIIAEAQKYKLQFIESKTMNNWVVAIFQFI